MFSPTFPKINRLAICSMLILLTYQCNISHGQTVLSRDEAQASAFLDYFSREAQMRGAIMAEFNWIYKTNITDYNQEKMIEYGIQYTDYWKEVGQNASMFNFSSFSYDTKRQLGMLQYIGAAALNDNETVLEINTLSASLRRRYSTSRVCVNQEDPPEDCYRLDPDLTSIMASNRNYTNLAWAWKGWRDAVGPSAKPDYIRKREILNKIAQANGYNDLGEVWRANYEIDNLEEQALKLYSQLRPLYENLHAYVRRKLYHIYGKKYINLRGPIPAHLLGNMWSQTWSGIYDLLKPFPDKPAVDITQNLQDQNFTALRMFQVSEEFFTSLGLVPMPQAFWDESMIEKPEDREVVCHASASDFGNQKDFRIKMCTDINMEEFVTIHHEMGHIQYFLQYMNQSYLYRGGANPGFHEAIGDTLALSVATPKHLHALGLLDELQEDNEADLNFLMFMATEKIAFLPFGSLMDQWRWAVFNGSIAPDQYNTKWWELRTKYQGIVPPVKRTEADFDPAAKYHIVADVPYIRYFISFVIQFQFQKALCVKANHVGPLHRCDIYRSREAGTLISNMMKMGQSRPWPEAMEVMTGQQEFDASALMEYFQPLTDWLVKQNEMNGDQPGWPDDQWMPPDPFSSSSSSRTAPSTVFHVVCAIAVLTLFSIL